MNQVPVQAMQSADLPAAATLGGSALPLVGRARVYACGITPYDVTHLGHAATFVWVDTLARVLQAGGAEVIVCRNVTDVDDVLLSAASRAGPAPGGPGGRAGTPNARRWRCTRSARRWTCRPEAATCTSRITPARPPWPRRSPG